MHKTIDDFKNLKATEGGLSSPTRYAVTILPPVSKNKKGQVSPDKGIMGVDGVIREPEVGERGGMSDMKQFYPENITLPSRSVATITDTHYGPVRQYPYRKQYNSEIVMTLTSSENQFERAYFEWWMDMLIDKNNRINVSAINNLTDNMFIYILSRSDQATAKFSIDGAYPSSIIPANYGYGMINEYARFQVTFRYRDYKFETL